MEETGSEIVFDYPRRRTEHLEKPEYKEESCTGREPMQTNVQTEPLHRPACRSLSHVHIPVQTSFVQALQKDIWINCTEERREAQGIEQKGERAG